MSDQRFSRACTVTLLAVLLASTVALAGSNERQFSGYFDLSAAQEQGELIQVTLHLKLFNHGDSNAKNVIVTLMDSSPAGMLRGSFQPVKVWKSQSFITMSQEFTVTKREFQEWMNPPAQPNLVILYQDTKGSTWQKVPQISRSSLVR